MPMNIFHVIPVHPLRPYIDRLWGWESRPGELITLPSLLPGTGAEVFFHYRTPFRRLTAAETSCALERAHLFCVRADPAQLCPSGDIGFVAIRFRAGSLHRFIDLPCAELLDTTCSASDLWGAKGRVLADGVLDAHSIPEKLRLIQVFLLKQLQRGQSDQLVELAIAKIYRAVPGLSIDDLAASLGIGRRQLERRFQALTGQTPSEVRRLSRFQKVVRALMLDHALDPLDAALCHGYYDQSHFIRDFKDLAMTTPKRHIDAARLKTHFYNTPLHARGTIIPRY